MIVCVDTEFNEAGYGQTIELLSIALVAADGREFYAVVREANWAAASGKPWLVENVFPHLPLREVRALNLDGKVTWAPDPDAPEVMHRYAIAIEVEAFLRATPDVELWADHPATDHVALYQLFGPMIECTQHGMPMRTNCLAQERVQVIRRGLLSHDWEFPAQLDETKHHALFDARHDMECARALGLFHLPFPWVQG